MLLAKMICKICNEEFTDSWKHIGINSKEIHNKVIDNFAKNGYGGNCPICDGKVKTRSAGYEGWTTECDKCAFLFDED